MYYYYRIANLTLRSSIALKSFKVFSCSPAEADVTIDETDEFPVPGPYQMSGSIAHRSSPDGWVIMLRYNLKKGLYTNTDYSHLRFFGATAEILSGDEEGLIRLMLECWFARHGHITLHSAAVEKDGRAYAFSGPSGMGKSTRANAWTEALNAVLINGDRPLIRVRDPELYGVPWDGKEQLFRNVSYPLETICEVRRSGSVYVRKMSPEQKRRLLLRQCCIPMWDTDTAAMQMANIARLMMHTEIVRIFCGPTGEDAQMLYDILKKKEYLKEEPDMKAKPGFVLRNVVDEYILMPTGDNIGEFSGTVLLNEVSAFVWEKLQTPLSKEDLLTAILDEFEVDRATASADLDALLETLRGYGVIEND